MGVRAPARLFYMPFSRQQIREIPILGHLLAVIFSVVKLPAIWADLHRDITNLNLRVTDLQRKLVASNEGVQKIEVNLSRQNESVQKIEANLSRQIDTVNSLIAAHSGFRPLLDDH